MDMTNKNVFDKNSVYDRVNKVDITKNKFDISYVYSARFDAGQLIPFYYQSTIPGGNYKIRNEHVLRTDPLLKPIFANMKLRTFYFFVPYRLLMGSSTYVRNEDSTIKEITYENDDKAFETFITGGMHGDGTLKGQLVTLPHWSSSVPILNDNWNGIPAGFSGSNASHVNVGTTSHGKYSLWSYFGLPDDIAPTDLDINSLDTKRPYNLIYNYYFRNKDLQLENDIDDERVMNANWNKDYFTSANTQITRVPAPQLPIDVTTTLDFSRITNARLQNVPNSTLSSSNSSAYLIKANAPGDDPTLKDLTTIVHLDPGSVDNYRKAIEEAGYNTPTFIQLTFEKYSTGASALLQPSVTNTSLKQALSGATAKSESFGFNMSDLRVALTIQQWLETNMRSGYLYKPFLESHFGISPNDDRLQEPEYIGGSTNNLIFSEVVQTSASDDESTQGNLAGNGLSAGSQYIADYTAKEFGVIIGICCVKPDAQYSQGIDRNFLRNDRNSFYFPMFQGLSEQSITLAEIYAQNSGNVDDSGHPIIFGYQGRFNEFRARHNIVGPGLRNEYDYWTIQRKFSQEPRLNGEFIKCRPSKDIFEVQDEPSLCLLMGNLVEAYLPLEPTAVPGLNKV